MQDLKNEKSKFDLEKISEYIPSYGNVEWWSFVIAQILNICLLNKLQKKSRPQSVNTLTGWLKIWGIWLAISISWSGKAISKVNFGHKGPGAAFQTPV